MELAVILQILAPDAISLVILFIVFFYGVRWGYVFAFGERYFRLSVLFQAFVVVSDAITVLLNGSGGQAAYWGNVIADVVYFASYPLVTFFVFLYSLELIGRKIPKVFKALAALPAAAVIIIAIASAFATGFIFWVDPATNLYARSSLLPLAMAVNFLYPLAAFLLLLSHRPPLPKTTVLVFSSVLLLPGLATILQMAIPMSALNLYLDISPSAMALATLIMFIYIVIQGTQTDYLTGLNNRRQFEEILRSVISRQKKNGYLIGLMLDINNFKAINDTFGHKEGDLALEKAAAILKAAVGRQGFLARYAGDEFVVLIQSDDPHEGERIAERIKEEEKRFDAADPKPYKIRFAVGYLAFARRDKITSEAFIEAIDQRMYADKRGLAPLD